MYVHFLVDKEQGQKITNFVFSRHGSCARGSFLGKWAIKAQGILTHATDPLSVSEDGRKGGGKERERDGLA